MQEGLLNVRHDVVRSTTMALLQQLAGSPAGHTWVLHQLDSTLPAADAVPHHCAFFYRLFCDLVTAILDMPSEVVPPRSCAGPHAPRLSAGTAAGQSVGSC